MIKKNLLVDCHVFDDTFQGTTTYLKGIYLEMIKEKKINFFFVAHDLEKIKNIFGSDENLFYLKYNSRNKFYRLLYEIPKLIIRNKIDFAHFQYIVPPIKLCTYIVTIHDVLFLDYPKYFPLSYKISKNILFRASANYSEYVLTVSNFSKERIEHHFKIKNVVVTPNAVDEEFFNNYNKNEIKIIANIKFGIKNYFLFVSRIEPRKNHLTLLKVFVENNFYKNYTLVFVGNKAIEDEKYNNYFAELPILIQKKIITFSNVNFEDLLIFVRAANLSIYPSIAEGFGIPPLESLAAKVPTICSNSTAMSDFDFIKDYLFDPLDEYDLANKINFALENSASMSSDKIKGKYNWKSSAQKIIKIIK